MLRLMEIDENKDQAMFWSFICLSFLLKVSLTDSLRGVVKKNQYFYGQADHKGWGGSAPSALAVSKCENFGPIFPITKW